MGRITINLAKFPTIIFIKEVRTLHNHNHIRDRLTSIPLGLESKLYLDKES
jgi:hypothetical protein